jgi:hypothetical protein
MMNIFPLRLAVPLLVLLVSGCAARGQAPMTQVASPCDRYWQLPAAEPVTLDDVRPQVLRMDASRRCGFRRDGSVATYVVLALPAFERPWSLRLESLIEDQRLFAPEVATLDADGQVLRRLPLDRFAMRGDRLQAHLFFAAADADERYLLLRSAPEAIGRAERQMVSRSFFIPVLNAILPILYVQGTERERQFIYSHDGLVQVQARSQEPPPGTPTLRDVARSELKAFLR